MEKKVTEMSIRQFWERIVEPSKHMDRLFAEYGMNHKFEYLLVNFAGGKIRKVKVYTISEDVLTDDDTMIMCQIDESQMGTTPEGRYIFYLTVTTIK